MRVVSKTGVAQGLLPYLIAEVGIAHGGSIDRAIHLVRVVATRCRADAIKFQIFVPGERLFCPLDGDEARWDRWMASVIPYGDWRKVREAAERYEIDFMASVFQPGAVKMLKRLKPTCWKVASRAAKSFPYDDVPGPFMISNGFGSLVPEAARGNSLLLDCRPKYPTPMNETLWDEKTDGISVHCDSPWPSIHALARGACVVEAHVKIVSDSVEGDWSLWPEDFEKITVARDAFAAMR